MTLAVADPTTVRALVPSLIDPSRLMPLPSGLQVESYDGPVPTAPRTDVAFFVPAVPPSDAARTVLPQLAGLEVVQVLTAGVDWIVNAIPPGVTLCNGRGVHDPSTAEWVLTVVLSMLRDIPRLVNAQQAGHWDYHYTSGLPGKTVLIVGAGSIGTAVERRLEPFGADVVRVARRPRKGTFAVTDLPHLLPEADVVVLLVPLTPATDGMVDAAFLAQMHDGALLVNASRGRVVDTVALLAELQSQRLRAALDVTEPEPLPPDHPLWSAPGVLITPHVAGSTEVFLDQAHRLLREQLGRHARGEPLANVVTEDY